MKVFIDPLLDEKLDWEFHGESPISEPWSNDDWKKNYPTIDPMNNPISESQKALLLRRLRSPWISVSDLSLEDKETINKNMEKNKINQRMASILIENLAILTFPVASDAEHRVRDEAVKEIKALVEALKVIV